MGDTGIYLSNTLSFSVCHADGQVTPFAGIDWGAIKNNGDSGSGGWNRRGCGWGSGVGEVGQRGGDGGNRSRPCLGMGHGVVWYLSASVNF
ncbi:ShlB/FhaC/HecB family hemolysin secretion/activation protein [Burkholderia ubonensis]|uniref:ShlB/FhaC/HecB family hemolysin secretion/activation protein n=1 Tax=Burkholderia ubonensis TaxID=101571 RepID=UPI0039F613D1